MDGSVGVMQSLFAPFPETMFPRTLDTTTVAGLLGAPLACRVPLPQSQYQHANRLFPDLFCPETTILHMIFIHFSSQLCRRHGQQAVQQSLFSQPSGIQLATSCLNLQQGTWALLSLKIGQCLSACGVHLAIEPQMLCGLPHAHMVV